MTQPDDTLDLGPLPSLVGYRLRRAQLAVFADFQRVFAPLGLRPAMLSVLLVLRHNPGVRASQVAETLGIQRTNFTVLLAELEGAGWVVRGPDARDRRAVALQLTEPGAALLVEADAALERHEAHWRARLGRGGPCAVVGAAWRGWWGRVRSPSPSPFGRGLG